ncbi:MAG: amidohydrolase family protein [Alphaproteobacteria bacterium]|nr:amidohydrolase family protein [Alphaproteobacteria bacterium]MCB9930360.1 amidohydrolase family protein [Alphaproteobacteria bacterium]
MDTVDLVIRGGTVADGSGDPLREADVAIAGDRIVAVGRVTARGREEIDASGKLVTPGFVDIHTHYDGQVTWTNQITPSSQHGVTTVVMGNCGVGFAPVRIGDHDRLMKLMEGVEDIPEPVLTAGLPWTWESFPDYVRWLAGRSYDLDVGPMLPHAALRVYVMGERGARREPATAADIAEMAKLAGEAIRAGALGFSTSRALNHRTSDGDYSPTLKAGEDELTAIAAAMQAAGGGVLQFILDISTIDHDLPMMLGIGERTGVPVTFSLFQHDQQPERWRRTMAEIEAAAARGLQVSAQVAARGIGIMLGFELTRHPFRSRPSYAAIADLPLAERVQRLRDPAVRARILAEAPAPDDEFAPRLKDYGRVFRLGNPPDYEQSPDDAIGPRARAQGIDPQAIAYDAMLEDEGRGMLYMPALNYADGSLDPVYEMLQSPLAIAGLSDGGAHCGIICDASFPTYLLTHWARDRARGEKLDLAYLVALQTRKAAEAFGLSDRGLIAPGYKADVNVIAFDRLQLHPPRVVHDLPEGGRRLVQQADGYEATIVSGVVTRRNGEATGALPGRMVLGRRAEPLARAAE